MSQFIGSTGQPGDWEEPNRSMSACGLRGFKRKAGTSRMSREAHVRICGGLEVRFLRSTRRYGGGVNLVQAFVCNVGTCCSDGKGEIQVEDPRE
jgi:hypothetical protein